MARAANTPTPSDDRTLVAGAHDDDDASSTISRFSSRSSFDSQTPPRRKRPSPRAATTLRAISFVAALISALCAGSITVFSMYGHIFQERLHYTQFQVNGLAISSSVALYLPVSFLGYICDRVGTPPLSLLAAILFSGGYAIAAGTYRKLEAENLGGLRDYAGRRIGGGADWTYPLMIFAFVCVGVGTCSMYLAAVATCAKNFGKGKHRGLALAVPIAAFGLSGMWLSQLGSHVFYERLPDGSAGDLDVFHFFVFLAILLLVVGVTGSFTLKVVDEEEIFEEAVEELERSGLLERSTSFLSARSLERSRNYGAIGQIDDEEDGGVLGPAEDDAKLRKKLVLNAETRSFLTDKTMWCFALGFLLMIGPGEAFINNLGTVIGTLYPPTMHYVGPPTSAATHVSIVGITSTIARLATGTLTDLLAPSPQTQHLQVSSTSPFLRGRPTISRVAFLLFFAIILSLGLVALASGLIQEHGERFWIVSGLIGSGYGAVFSLTPIIITVIWGVENFATNWGIVAMFPALGSTFWGLVYSAVYQSGAENSPQRGGGSGGGGDVFCYGAQCYAPTFWAMAVTVWVACGMILFAWKGKGGWAQRGIII
ncbi:MFS monocarboxylic acid transporter [Colletotrichum abscissum]|uniref:Probable transporter MCH1 n=3 Tax=Colletotrichum acutatum species complex TaxID=2707335 RepID=A0A9P9XMC8_9PEZI|nr:MFS monocarboxylic acid transporter [Colletotrichum costaricense]XP_060379076.1 MFS monocarboxylic acid transporter [Colletotrichum tamarilloi]XP_060391367.1 MFS monocarboxylic acid transporter [Colletotrichum abscissum]KAI3556484.1 MFS monocarboxylic acid transporter [Colletotrichum abscissum]KAK1475460.1 MFS monocarboxylic acid transporter [Colletotrichum abscissum]KAK1491561.1 MFS monocarboxylic acid transporter [Colletotrichum tamarilloi]KAK1534904.1 MFS monocarboxylic acid transporter